MRRLWPEKSWDLTTRVVMQSCRRPVRIYVQEGLTDPALSAWAETKAADYRLMKLVVDIAREPGPVISLYRGAAGSHAGEDANWPCDLASGFGEQLARSGNGAWGLLELITEKRWRPESPKAIE